MKNKPKPVAAMTEEELVAYLKVQFAAEDYFTGVRGNRNSFFVAKPVRGRKVGHCVASFANATERKPHSAVVAGRKTSFIPISLQRLAAQGGG